MKEFIIGLVIMALFSFMILDCGKQEEELVKKHCTGLTGYQYGQCQMSIY